ncbi:MAG: circadian clock protein KaiC [Isosphaera sp.]|nr:circadian clock protein KaiC [Isosphaera sp.]
MNQKKGAVQSIVPTGIPGLDEILRGGLPQGHLYLVEGDAGAGKTTLGLQFLLEGKRLGEKTLWLSLSETEAQLRGTSESHGWDLTGIEIRNLTQSGDGVPDAQYSFFSPADIELNDITKAVMEVVEKVNPSRVVFDPFSDVKLLARDPLRYRRQVLQLREFFVRRKNTVLLIQERTSEGSSRDPSAEGVVQGIFALYQGSPDFGRQRRRLRVHKLRGVNFREGFHDVSIETGGMQVFPRLIAADHAEPPRREEVSTGVPELDAMMGGGLDRGASLLILGPAGVGKSTLGTQFSVTAVGRGEKAAIYLFDETTRAFTARGEGLRMGVEGLMADGRLHVRQVDPAEFTPGEFAHDVRRGVEQDGVKLVVIDSLNGYLNGMPDERHLSMHLHELLTYLSYRNVLTVLTMNQHGFMGDSIRAPVDVSYLADAALLLRYFEAGGAVRRAASVMKRRCGPHEVHIREMTVDPSGVRIGQVLTEFRGVLTGQPDYTGGSAGLSERERSEQGQS